MIFFRSLSKTTPKISVFQKILHQSIMTSTKELLFSKLSEIETSGDDKVTIIGSGDVGTAITVCTMMQELASDIVMVDINVNKMEGEVMDLQHGSRFISSKIKSSPDFTESAGSKIGVITAGARQAQGETRMDILNKNFNIMKTIIPKFLKTSPDAILIMVTNPVDVMTWMAWKISGLPKHKVIGSGCMLDSARFSYFVAEKLGVSADSVDGLIIGEHGDSSVAVWSHLNVNGIRLQDINPNIAKPGDTENWKLLHKKVVDAAYEIIKLKGFTNWAIGVCTSKLIKCILKNMNQVFPVSTYIKGNCGIEHEIFLSLPAVIGKNGVSNIVQLDLNVEESCQLKMSAHKILDAIGQVNL